MRIKPAYAPKKLLYQNENEKEQGKDGYENPQDEEEKKDWEQMTKEEKSSYKKEKKVNNLP